MLSLENLAIGYKVSSHEQKCLAEGISTSLIEGEFVCLLGPNGAGKSTLIRTLAGMQMPLSGVVWLGKNNLHKFPSRELAKYLSVVLTDRIDVGNLTVYDLVALGRHPFTDWAGRFTDSDRSVVRWAIEATNIEDFIPRPVSELSDGERQKVMIARALAQEPRIMILDEPTAFLDLPRRVEIMGLLRDLAHNAKCSVLVTTHDLDIALRTADKIWLLSSKGMFVTGIPEQLVLDRSFERVFESEGVKFDSDSGSFEIVRKKTIAVSIKGQGLVAFWTARALEREGFNAIKNEPNLLIQIEVITDGDIHHWHLRLYDNDYVVESLLEVILCLKNNLSSKVPIPPSTHKAIL